MVEFSINNQKYSVTRPKLRKWLDIEKTRSKVFESADDKGKFTDNLFDYLSALLDIEQAQLELAPWWEVVDGYILSSLECYPRLDLSILLSGKEKKNKLPDPWDYEERSTYSWLHLIARTYGWTLEYINELDVDDAFALIQEISLSDQFEKEWEWARTELAYDFDKSTNKSTLRPLPRPEWMALGNRNFQKALEDKKPKGPFVVRQDWIPPGVVIYNVPEENKASNADRSSNTV